MSEIEEMGESLEPVESVNTSNSTEVVSQDSDSTISPSVSSDSEESTESPNFEIDEDLRARSEQIEKLNLERVKLDAEVQKLSDEIGAKELEFEEFSTWVDKHRKSFLWKMLEKMRSQTEEIKQSQDFFSSFMQNLEIPVPGELVRLRKRFHKSILTIVLTILAIWLVFLFITSYLPFWWAKNLSNMSGRLIGYTIASFISATLSALILYYRDWRRIYPFASTTY